MAVDLEERLAHLLEDWSEWQRLTDLFAPDLPAPGRQVQIEDVTHGSTRALEPAELVRWAVPGVWDDEPEPQQVVPSVGELVEQVDRLLVQIDAVDPALLPPGQALGETQALIGIAHRVRHALLGRTRDVQTRHLYEHLGYRSAAAWQSAAAPDAVTGDRTLARRLNGARVLAGALDERSVSFAAATKTAACLARLRPQLDRFDGRIDGLDGEQVVTAVLWNVVDTVCQERFGLEHDPTVDPEEAAFLAQLVAQVQAAIDEGGSQVERVEKALVLLARHIPVKRLKPALEDLELQLLPNTLEQQDKDAQDKRALALSKNNDGTWHLEGTLTPEVGEQVFAALASEARRDPVNPEDTKARADARADAARAQAELDGTDPDLAAMHAALDVPEWEARALRERGDSPLNPDHDELVPRSRSKRLHDALGRLLTRYLAQGLGGTRSKVPVQATVTLSHRTIEGAPGAPPAHGGSGRPLARSVVRRWWCDAKVTLLLMSEGWKPLGVIHAGRTVTATEMTASLTQFDNRCPGIGCCSGEPDPLTPLIPHHVYLYSQHGETSVEATVPACPNLHDDIHVGKRVIRLRDGRFISEDGFLHSPE